MNPVLRVTPKQKAILRVIKNEPQKRVNPRRVALDTLSSNT